MRLDHLQRERGGDTGVEGIAALFQDGHPDRGRDPVGRGDDAKSAFDFGPRRERIGIDYCSLGVMVHWCRVGRRHLTTAGAALPTGTRRRTARIIVMLRPR